MSYHRDGRSPTGTLNKIKKREQKKKSLRYVKTKFLTPKSTRDNRVTMESGDTTPLL